MAAISLAPGQRPSESPDVLSPIFWRDDRVVMIDQRRLPGQEIWTAYDSWEDVARAISEMEVRGAPAIGCAAAFGVALAWRKDPSPLALRQVMRALGATRPTAINLGAALHRMANALVCDRDPVSEARALWSEDLSACRSIGAHGAALLPDDGFVLTHCNAGALATAGYGTALGVIRAGIAAGKKFRVLCDETRPWLQGARLTSWELSQDGIPCAVIVDGAAGSFLARGEVGAVVVGADRITRRGDVANKIGTVGLAATASVFGVPFIVAAPQTTVDVATESGASIPIEERSGDEVTRPFAQTVVPAGVATMNPVFDVTPSRLVGAIVTERGVFRGPYDFAERR
jgi:methylthioribose-1-phosphate isomerase